MPDATSLPVIDARAATRARQTGRAGLREVVVTVTQVATGRRQAVRVAAPDGQAARALAMMHATILEGAPRGVDPAAQAARRLEFAVRPDGGGPLEAPGPAAPAAVNPRDEPTRSGADPADYAGYSVVIAAHPHYWTTEAGEEPEPLEARRKAELLADTARNVFPGLRCDLVPGAVEKLDLSSGPDAGVRGRLEAWVERRMGEMLAAE